MTRVLLTDKFIRSRPPAPKDKRSTYHDSQVPGFALRVTDRGHKSFVLVKRYPGAPGHPARRALGDCYLPTSDERADSPAAPIENGALTLAEARTKARRWTDLIARGIDPREELERERAANAVARARTFAAVAEAFIAAHVSKLRKRTDAERLIRGDFIKRWGRLGVTEVTPAQIREAIRAIKDRGAPAQAHNALGYIRGLYNWAIRSDEWGVTVNPAEKISAPDLIGQRVPRARILSDDEIRAVWAAAEKEDYPFGDIVKLLLLTGQREKEIGDLSWSEIDLEGARLIIPARRMKGGLEHAVPLAPMAVAILRSVPRFVGGDYVFSSMSGKQPVVGYGRPKRRIDRLSGTTGWVIHDIRRTARSHFSALPGVQDVVRELVIAHVQSGIRKVYDRHTYMDEKRHCLELWEKRLIGILEPVPAGVSDIDVERRMRGVA